MSLKYLSATSVPAFPPPLLPRTTSRSVAEIDVTQSPLDLQRGWRQWTHAKQLRYPSCCLSHDTDWVVSSGLPCALFGPQVREANELRFRIGDHLIVRIGETVCLDPRMHYMSRRWCTSCSLWWQ